MNLFEDLFGRESEYSASPEKIRNATEKEIAEYNRVMLTDHWRSMARETIEILDDVYNKPRQAGVGSKSKWWKLWG